MMDRKLDRRELIQRTAALMGGALSSGTVAGLLAGCATTPDTSGTAVKSGFLKPSEMSIVTAMSDQIIPRTDTPGAVDVGVPAFVDRMLAGFYQDKERKAFRDGLKMVATDASELAGVPFAQLTAAQQVSLMKEYDRLAYAAPTAPGAPPAFFRLMKELTIVGYCTSEPGATKFFAYAPIPGPYRADIPYSEVGKAWQS